MAMRDVLGDFHTDALIGELKAFQEQMQKLGLKSPRPWGEFLGELKPPKKWRKEEVEERIHGNFLLYRANYLVLLAVALSWSLLTSPFTMGAVLVCAVAFALLLGWRGQLEVLGRVLTPRDRMAVAGAFSAFFLLMTGAAVKLVWSFAVGITCCIAHMVLRPRSAHAQKLLNEEISLSHSHKGKDEAGGDDIESPKAEEGGTAGSSGSGYQTEAQQRVSARGGGKPSPRGA